VDDLWSRHAAATSRFPVGARRVEREGEQVASGRRPTMTAPPGAAVEIATQPLVLESAS